MNNYNKNENDSDCYLLFLDVSEAFDHVVARGIFPYS